MRTGIFSAPPAFFIVMRLSDLKRGETALVLSVAADTALRERLKVLGIHAGARVKLLKTSVFRSTFLLATDSGKAALGRSVAEEIKICRLS